MDKFDAELFICEIKNRPSIWDTTSKKNADKELKRKDWDEIIDIFGEKNMSPADRRLLALTLQKRWKNIRTCFARELKRQKNYGSGVGRKSEYIYYKRLTFLKDVMNIVDKEMSEPEYVYYDDNDTKILQSHEYIEDKPKCEMSEYEEPFHDLEDEDRLFLLSLYKTLKRVPNKRKMAVKIKMLSVLNETLQ